MTQPQGWECAQARISLGVYVLGAIDPAERALVDAHLATCRECRDELAGLASLPALLARLGPEELSRIEAGAEEPEEVDAPPELIGTVLDLTTARRKRTRWRYLGAAAAVVAMLAGVFGGIAATRSPGPAPVSALDQMADWWGPGALNHYSAVSHQTGASADVYLAPRRWGTGFGMDVNGIAVGTTCQVFVNMKGGGRLWLASWTTSYDEGTVGYTASRDVSASDIASLTIDAAGKTLVTIPVT